MATIKQLQRTLKFTFGIVPIVAGLDKFTNLLTHWVDYLGNIRSIIPFDHGMADLHCHTIIDQWPLF